MIKVKKLCPGDLLPPKQSKPGDAGYDLRSASESVICVMPGFQKVIPTGFSWEIPISYVGLVRPRSGLAVKNRIDTRAGVVDSGYRDEVKVVIANEGHSPFLIHYGDRIAQMVVVPHMMGSVVEVDELGTSERGSEGFGSSGIK